MTPTSTSNPKNILYMLKNLCFFVFFCILILTSNSVFCKASDFDASTNNLAQLLNKKKLVVALPATDDPGLFAIDKQGKLQGYDIDLAQDIANKLGLMLEFNRQAKTFDEAVEITAKGGADIAICNLSKTLARAKKILYSNTYATFYQTVLFNKLWLSKFNKNPFTDKNPLTQILQKEKFVLGVLEGSSYAEFAKKQFINANIKMYSTNEKLFAALEKNEIQALLEDDFDIKMRILNNPSLAIKFNMLFLPNDKDLIAMAVAPNAVMLQNWLNVYLELNNINMSSDTILIHNNQKKSHIPE